MHKTLLTLTLALAGAAITAITAAAPADGPETGELTIHASGFAQQDLAPVRVVFRDLSADAFRWTWESSPDDGATWIVRWEIDYRRAG